MADQSHIRKLWAAMADMYGLRWTKYHGDHDQNNIWLRALEDLPWKMLEQGLTTCMFSSDPWPPSLPQFRHSCFTLPDKDICIRIAINMGHSDSEFINAMRKYIGSWNLLNLTEQRLQSIADNAYEMVAAIYRRQEIAQVKALTHENTIKPKNTRIDHKTS